VTDIPFIDPETGEILAASSEERAVNFQAAMRDYAEAREEMDLARERAERAGRAALTLWQEVDPPVVVGRKAFLVESVKPPRKVDIQAIAREVERLPASLRPKTITKQEEVYPGVREVERAKGILAGVGLKADDLLIAFPASPRIKIIDIEEEA
jgi:hypothetical protein